MKNFPMSTRMAEPELPFMFRAIELAEQCTSEDGKVAPKVGAVIVRGSVKLGEAYRGELKAGEHAEYTLIARKLDGVNLEGTTLYTTLEPCTIRNHPKIPCVNLIIARKIKKVFIGTLDPDRRIQGEGQQKLVEAGVEVALFDPSMMKEIVALNADFHLHHRPARERTYGETHDPVEPGQVGLNGGRIGYLPNGDKVEWVHNKKTGEEHPHVLRRNDQQIFEAYAEFMDKSFATGYKLGVIDRIERGELEPTESHRVMREFVVEIQRAYGAAAIAGNEFERGLIGGKCSALAWVIGMDWNANGVESPDYGTPDKLEPVDEAAVAAIPDHEIFLIGRRDAPEDRDNPEAADS